MSGSSALADGSSAYSPTSSRTASFGLRLRLRLRAGLALSLKKCGSAYVRDVRCSSSRSQSSWLRGLLPSAAARIKGMAAEATSGALFGTLDQLLILSRQGPIKGACPHVRPTSVLALSFALPVASPTSVTMALDD
eukprot:355325-Chlamydomonas_euryale.AAC.2